MSLCLHEYAHARTALHSGDISIGAKGYLTLNPLKYTHALLSIVLPVIFVIMGGIGLPGGAVFIERGRIQGPLAAQPDLGGGPADERPVRRRAARRRSGCTPWTAYRRCSATRWRSWRCSR